MKRITKDYIAGSQDTLSHIVTQLGKSLEAYADGTPGGTVAGINEFISYLYYKQDEIETMVFEMAREAEMLEDPLEEHACTVQEQPMFIIKKGKLIQVFKGGR